MAPGLVNDEPTIATEAPYPTVKTSFKPRASYQIIEEPIHTRRPLRIVCMGAGYSGLMMGIICSQKMQDRNIDFVIYERNHDIGGTWLENRYPGCSCDIPAHNYAYSFEPNAQWPSYYATSGQIHDYMRETKEKYDIGKYIKFGSSIKHARWDERTGKWQLRIEDSEGEYGDECDVFINAGGVLNNWKWPNVDGLHEFRGKLMHSANWDADEDLTGKRVAVIGIGSSAIQIIPKVASIASHVTSFIRSQAWISPAPGINEPTDNDPEMDENYNYAPHIIERFKNDPDFCLQHRRDLINRRIQNFRRSMAASKTQSDAQELFKRIMIERLGDSPKGRELAQMLIPKFPVGCRRQTPGQHYLEALLQDNVDTRWDDIGRVTEKGILTKGGEELEFDVIVCATGFDTTFQPRFPLIGRNGVDLAQLWKDEFPMSYFGVAVPGCPNYYTFIGPGSPISNGSLVIGIQMMAIYIYKCIDKLQTEGIKSLEVSHAAAIDYNEHIQKFLERTVWVGGCRSWYKRGTTDGPVVAIYGGTSFHYVEALRHPRWEDYNIELLTSQQQNRFAYLGNGFTMRETKNGKVSDTQTLNFEEYFNLLNLPELYD